MTPAACSIDRALALNPNLAFAWLAIGWLKVWLGKPEAALQHLAHATRMSYVTLRYAAASNALAGRMEEAQQAMARLRQIDPELRISNLKNLTPLRRPEDRARYEEGMRKAGLPE